MGYSPEFWPEPAAKLQNWRTIPASVMAKAKPRNEAEDVSDVPEIAEGTSDVSDVPEIAEGTSDVLPRVPRPLLSLPRAHIFLTHCRGALGCVSSTFFSIGLQIGELS